MKKMAKGIVFFGFFLVIVGIILCTKDSIYVLVDSYLAPQKYISLDDKNNYYRNVDFDFVQNTSYFVPAQQQDLLNIYYTVINSGTNSFTFFCTKEYPNCLKDVQIIANDQELLSDINNYTHPYNGFAHIETEYDNVGRVTINIVHNYTPEEITEINNKVEDLYSQLVNNNDSTYNNIRRVHDYIINHARYDTAKADHDDNTYKSNNAYGPLFQGMAVCGGYTDLMQLFLEKMNVPNYRISSDQHVWNAVYINGKWLHLDLTWDDPVYEDGHQVLDHSFFLIDTNQLLRLEQTQHTFNENHYLEYKRA